MLKISHKLGFVPRQTLAPVMLPVGDDNDDELLAAINNDHQDADNNWELSDVPDVPGLENFWSGVQQDLVNDPEWFSFANEDDDVAH